MTFDAGAKAPPSLRSLIVASYLTPPFWGEE